MVQPFAAAQSEGEWHADAEAARQAAEAAARCAEEERAAVGVGFCTGWGLPVSAFNVSVCPTHLCSLVLHIKSSPRPQDLLCAPGNIMTSGRTAGCMCRALCCSVPAAMEWRWGCGRSSDSCMAGSIPNIHSCWKPCCHFRLGSVVPKLKHANTAVQHTC